MEVEVEMGEMEMGNKMRIMRIKRCRMKQIRVFGKEYDCYNIKIQVENSTAETMEIKNMSLGMLEITELIMNGGTFTLDNVHQNSNKYEKLILSKS